MKGAAENKKKTKKEIPIEIILVSGESRIIMAARIEDFTLPEAQYRRIYNSKDNVIGYIPIDAYIMISSYVLEEDE